MGKHHTAETTDILQERYKGSSPVVAGAGYVYISHLVSMIAGAVALGALGAIASNKTLAVKEAFTKFGAAHADSSNLLKQAAGFIVGGIPKIADFFATKVAGATKKVSRGRLGHMNETTDKAAAIAFGTGVGAATGWIGSTIWGILKGGHEGSVGKQQFNRAKAEIKELRARNDDLEKINGELHSKYVKASIEKDDVEQAAPRIDAMEANAVTHEPQGQKPSHHIHAHSGHSAAEHHGKLHAHAPHEQMAHAHA